LMWGDLTISWRVKLNGAVGWIFFEHSLLLTPENFYFNI